jgi:hypothetical protein
MKSANKSKTEMGMLSIGIRHAGLLKFDMPSHKSNASPERCEGKRSAEMGHEAFLIYRIQ